MFTEENGEKIIFGGRARVKLEWTCEWGFVLGLGVVFGNHLVFTVIYLKLPLSFPSLS